MKKLAIVLLLFLFFGVIYSQESRYSRIVSPLHTGLNLATDDTTLANQGDVDTLNLYISFGKAIQQFPLLGYFSLTVKIDTASFYVAPDTSAKTKGKTPAVKIDWAKWSPKNDEILYTHGVSSQYHSITDSIRKVDTTYVWDLSDSIEYCAGIQIRFSFGDDSVAIPSIVDTFRRVNIEYIWDMR